MRVRRLPPRLPHGEEATVVEHVEELRQRVFVAIGAIAIGTVAAFLVHDRILDALSRPLPPAHRHLVTFGVAEPLSVSLSVSIYAGVVLASPVILWQVWSFFAPALDPGAERRILSYAAFAALLATAGLAFGYDILLPRAVGWLTDFDAGNFHVLIRADSYFSFVTSVLAGVAAMFELPFVVLAAVSLGILRSSALRRNRRVGYVIVAAIALALPGPDPVTTVLELLPMWALFEGSIWLAVVAERRRARVGIAGAAA
jgi:sec-independent protein translocase protein TatC